MVNETVDMKTPIGSFKNVPMSFLGWLGMALLAGYLVFKMTGSFEEKLTRMSEEMPRQTVILKQIHEELRDRR
jgi:hypothetical protein